MSKILVITNQKGGVGKTSTAINLASALASYGKKVLLVDIDPQGNTTSGLGIEKRQLNRCIYDVLMNNVPIEDVLIETCVENLSLIPSTLRLAGAEIELVAAISRENRLKTALENVCNNYDYIFIDCPPSLGLLTINGLTASSGVLIPIQCEYYALEGLSQLLDVIKLIKERLNSSLNIEGVLLTMYDARVRLSEQVAQEVRNYFGEKIYNAIIPRNIKISESPSFGKPVILYDPHSRGAQAYLELAKEVMQNDEQKCTREGFVSSYSGKPDRNQLSES